MSGLSLSGLQRHGRMREICWGKSWLCAESRQLAYNAYIIFWLIFLFVLGTSNGRAPIFTWPSHTSNCVLNARKLNVPVVLTMSGQQNVPNRQAFGDGKESTDGIKDAQNVVTQTEHWRLQTNNYWNINYTPVTTNRVIRCAICAFSAL